MRFTSIEIFGDSILRGAIARRGERMSLRQDHDYSYLQKLGFQIRNNAHIGSTIEKGLEEIRYRLPFLTRNTAVVLSFGGNDCDFDWEKVSKEPEREHSAKVGLENYLRLYQEAIRLIREMGAGVFACTLVPLDSEKYFSYISGGKDKKALLHWLGDTGMLYRWHEGYNRALEDLAMKTGTPLIDLRKPFLMDRDYHKKMIGYDGIHPTEEGYRLIDQTFQSWAETL